MVNKIFQYYLKNLYRSALLSPSQLRQKQEKTWRQMRSYLLKTELAKNYHLHRYETLATLHRDGPILTYQDLSPYIERTLNLEKNIMTPDLPIRVGLTSGTTGKHGKKIPLTQPMLNHFNWSRRFLLSSLVEEFSVEPIRHMKSLSLSAQADLYNEKGISYGYISGIINQYVPLPLKGNFYPQRHLPSPEYWEQRVQELHRQLCGVSLHIIAGIPAVMVETLEGLCQHFGVSSLKHQFPELRYCVFGGTDIALYRKRLNDLCGRELNYFGSYVATEAPIGIPLSSSVPGSAVTYLLNPNIIVGFQSLKSVPTILSVDEVEEGERYRLVLSMPNGFIQYPLMDEIEVLGVKPYFSFKVIGRQGGALNLATEKIDELGLATIIQAFKDRVDAPVFAFMVAPYADVENPCYEFFLFIDDSGRNEFKNLLSSTQTVKAWAVMIDDMMMQKYQDYKESRQVGILKPAEVKILPSESLKKFIRHNAELGQIKIPMVFRERKDLIQFLETKLALKPIQWGILYE